MGMVILHLLEVCLTAMEGCNISMYRSSTLHSLGSLEKSLNWCNCLCQAGREGMSVRDYVLLVNVGGPIPACIEKAILWAGIPGLSKEAS